MGNETNTTPPLQEHFAKATGPQVIMPKNIQKYLGLTQAQMVKATGFSTLIAADEETRRSVAKIALQNDITFIKADKDEREEIVAEEYVNADESAEFIENQGKWKAIIYMRNFPDKQSADTYYKNDYKKSCNLPEEYPVDSTDLPAREHARLTFYHEASHLAMMHGVLRLPDAKETTELESENEADIRGIYLYLKDSPPEEKTMRLRAARAWEDSRAIATMRWAGEDVGHSTNLFYDVDKGVSPSIFDGQEKRFYKVSRSVNALIDKNAGQTMTNEFLGRFHIGLNEKDKMDFSNMDLVSRGRYLNKKKPEIQYAVAKALLNRGAFDLDPMAKDMVQEYVEAIDRRVPAIGKNENVLAMSAELERTMPDSALTLNKGGQAVAQTAKASMLSIDP